MKRGRKRKGYFYEEQEQAVVDYLNEKDLQKRELIFNTWLHPAFTQMIESIIRRYKFFYPTEEFEETKNDTYSYMITKLKKYNPKAGKKAYSYFGTVCKNFLLAKADKYKKTRDKQESYETKYDALSHLVENTQDNQHIDFLTKLIDETCEKIQEMIDDDSSKLSDDEIKVGLALINIFRNWNEIFVEELGSKKFNKTKVLLYLQELTRLKTPEIRNKMKKYRVAYYALKKIMIEDY